MSYEEEDIDLGYSRIMRDFAKMHEGAEVNAGILGGAMEHDGNLNVAAYAALNEYGEGVPERPFMRNAIDNNMDKYRGLSESLAGEVLDGKRTVDNMLTGIGEEMVSDMKLSILSQDFTPLAEATVAAKGHDTILVDSSIMLNSIKEKVGKLNG